MIFKEIISLSETRMFAILALLFSPILLSNLVVITAQSQANSASTHQEKVCGQVDQLDANQAQPISCLKQDDGGLKVSEPDSTDPKYDASNGECCGKNKPSEICPGQKQKESENKVKSFDMEIRFIIQGKVDEGKLKKAMKSRLEKMKKALSFSSFFDSPRAEQVVVHKMSKRYADEKDGEPKACKSKKKMMNKVDKVDKMDNEKPGAMAPGGDSADPEEIKSLQSENPKEDDLKDAKKKPAVDGKHDKSAHKSDGDTKDVTKKSEHEPNCRIKYVTVKLSLKEKEAWEEFKANLLKKKENKGEEDKSLEVAVGLKKTHSKSRTTCRPMKTTKKSAKKEPADQVLESANPDDNKEKPILNAPKDRNKQTTCVTTRPITTCKPEEEEEEEETDEGKMKKLQLSNPGDEEEEADTKLESSNEEEGQKLRVNNPEEDAKNGTVITSTTVVPAAIVTITVGTTDSPSTTGSTSKVTSPTTEVRTRGPSSTIEAEGKLFKAEMIPQKKQHIINSKKSSKFEDDLPDLGANKYVPSQKNNKLKIEKKKGIKLPKFVAATVEPLDMRIDELNPDKD